MVAVVVVVVADAAALVAVNDHVVVHFSWHFSDYCFFSCISSSINLNFTNSQTHRHLALFRKAKGWTGKDRSRQGI